MPEGMIALAIAFGLGWPVWLTMVIVRHREKMRQLEHKQQGSPGLVEEVQALRREVAHLRETTMHFDMSFDAALDRLERRMENVEQGSRFVESESEPVFPAAATYGAADATSVPLRRS